MKSGHSYRSARHGDIWYFYDSEIDEVLDNLEDVWPEIRCDENTMRWTENGPGGLMEARKAIERHIRKYFMRIQTPMGANPKLIAWMEVS